MKVKELIKILQDEDPNDMVILSCDSEGNGFDTMSNNCLSNGYWDDEDRLYYAYDEVEDVIPTDPKVVCIWPG